VELLRDLARSVEQRREPHARLMSIVRLVALVDRLSAARTRLDRSWMVAATALRPSSGSWSTIAHLVARAAHLLAQSKPCPASSGFDEGACAYELAFPA